MTDKNPPVALVIGASRGLGLECVRQLLASGARVIATVRSAAARAQLQAMGAQVLTVDVADPASVSSLAWLLDSEKIDLALYVAGVWSDLCADTPPTQQAFDRVMHTNVLGAMQVLPQVAPLVQAASGVFGLLSSEMSRLDEAGPDAWLYRVSKAALNMAVASAQHDYPQATLVALNPGWVQTDMGGDQAPLTAPESVAAMRATLSRLTPAQRGQFLERDGSPFASW